MARVITDPFGTMTELNSFMPDVFIIEITMRGLNGFQLCRVLRAIKKYQRTPLIFLSKTNKAEDRIRAYEYGGDGFFAKPINHDELSLFVQAMLKRMGSSASSANGHNGFVVVGPLALDETDRSVKLEEEAVELTPIQFKLIRSLMLNKGRVLSRYELHSSIWPHLERTDSRTIDVHIRRIREKLKSNGSLIETVRGIGYRVHE